MTRILDQTEGYERLAELFAFFADWEIARLDKRAAEEFGRLREQGIRIGTMDLKIASIALVQNATLLTANLRHFQKVPGLRVENWIE